jgi:galactokinase/mevalonate kinase-like predicted kinase
MIIRTRSFPRAALIGNPSDGYFGKTVAFVFGNYRANLMLYETPELDLQPSFRDHTHFSSIEHLASDVSTYGYYGGIRLLKATIKRFYEHCCDNDISLDNRNFTIRYESDIPNRLGLAGSSAIITACIRALKQFYGVKISRPVLANLVLSVETEELGISAGLQDRVAQAYNTPIMMDFDQAKMSADGYGGYTPLEIPEDLNLFVAFRTDLSEGSEILHSRLREKYEEGNPAVLAAIEEWKDLTVQSVAAIKNHDYAALDACINRNFDLRCEVCSSVSSKNRQMVELAREVGASAKFTGSGGAIIGTYRNEAMYQQLTDVLTPHQIDVIKPEIVRGGRSVSYNVEFDNGDF